MTVDDLKKAGADTDSGVARCVGKEDFYLRLVGMVLQDAQFDDLKAAVERKDLAAAFGYAHTLKGMLGNVSLTPLLRPVEEMTEALRAETDMDYTPLLDEMMQQLEIFRGLM